VTIMAAREAELFHRRGRAAGGVFGESDDTAIVILSGSQACGGFRSTDCDSSTGQVEREGLD
jgi:hypothetical protein